MTTKTTVYKLTKQDLTTYNGFQYSIGKESNASGVGELCGPGWLHAYEDPLLGLFLNPLHANIKNPRLWEAIAGVPLKNDRGLKCGTTSLTLIRELVVPKLTTEHSISFGILCSKKVYKESEWISWAESWLSNTDRSPDAAYYAADAAAGARAAHAAYYAADAAAGALAADTAYYTALAAAGALAADTAYYTALAAAGAGYKSDFFKDVLLQIKTMFPELNIVAL